MGGENIGSRVFASKKNALTTRFETNPIQNSFAVPPLSNCQCPWVAHFLTITP